MSGEHGNGRRDGNNRACKDNGHDAGHVQLQRQGGILSAVHLSAHNSFRILHGQSALGVGHKDHKGNQCHTHNQTQHADDRTDPPQIRMSNRVSAIHQIRQILVGIEDQLENPHQRIGERSHDVGKQDHGNAVADTVFRNLFTQPHNQGRTCAIAGDHHHCGEEFHAGAGADIIDQPILLQVEIVTDGRYQRQGRGNKPGNLVDFLLSVLFLAHSLQSGNCHAEQLHHNGRSNVRRDGKRKQCCTAEGFAREDVQVLQQSRVGAGIERVQHIGINKGYRDLGAQPVNHQNEEGKKDL